MISISDCGQGHRCLGIRSDGSSWKSKTDFFLKYLESRRWKHWKHTWGRSERYHFMYSLKFPFVKSLLCIIHRQRASLMRVITPTKPASRLLRKLGLDLLQDPAKNSWEYTQDTSSYYRDNSSTMLTAALFKVTRSWKQHRCSSTDEWIKKCVHLHNEILFSC